MAASVWRKWINLLVGGTVRFKKNSGGFEIVNSDGTVTTVATNELAKLDATSRIVTTTATALSLTATQHADRIVLVNSNSTVANTVTLPEATGSGNKYTVINNITQTQGSVVVAANGTDVMAGVCVSVDSTGADVSTAWYTTATSDKLSMNITTTGGLGGDIVEAIDTADGTMTIQARTRISGTAVTPFSAT